MFKQIRDELRFNVDIYTRSRNVQSHRNVKKHSNQQHSALRVCKLFEEKLTANTSLTTGPPLSPLQASTNSFCLPLVAHDIVLVNGTSNPSVQGIVFDDLLQLKQMKSSLRRRCFRQQKSLRLRILSACERKELKDKANMLEV